MSDGDAMAAMMTAQKLGRASWRGQEILHDDVEVTFEPAPGFAASTDRVGSVFLDTTLDDELRGLGLVRELQNRLQNMRKEMGLEYTDRIRVVLYAGQTSQPVVDLVRLYGASMAAELLADSIEAKVGAPPPDPRFREIEVEGERIHVALHVAVRRA
jgi:isoleucyl-tRNA synthetase